MEPVLIAHTQNEKKSNEDQPLRDHALNVAAYMEHALSSITLGKLGALIGLMHDVGKASEAWQNWIMGTRSEHPAHSNYGRILYNKNLFPKRASSLASDDDFRFIVANVILGHHSNLYDAIGLNEENIRINGQQTDTRSLEHALTQQAVDNDVHDRSVLDRFLSHLGMTADQLANEYEAAFKEFEQWTEKSQAHFLATCADEAQNRYGFYKSFLQMLLLSALNDADTLDTQRHHDDIPFSIEDHHEWAPYASNIESLIASFVPRYDIDHIRSEISDACRKDADIVEDIPKIKRLSVFTGGGKTLCSARYALNYAATNNKSKLFYVIPFTTIIDQTADVFSSFLDDESNILVHHSNALNAKQENGSSTINYDEDIILTTQVRFLDGVFGSDRKSNKLFCKYINSVVIFDEFQAIPEKIIDMFYVLVDFMSQTMHCNVILCSATQLESSNVNIPIDLLSGVDWEEKYRNKLRRTEYIEYVSYDKDPITAEEIVFNAVAQNQTSLAITNTKNQAEELFISIDMEYADNDSVDVFYLSTNMYMNHRKKTLEKIKDSLSSDRITILISTSLIEAGVDISFENCIRYENGLDHVIQSGGRCNRNGELGIGYVYVIPEPDDLRSKGYRDQQQALHSAISQNSDQSIDGALATYYKEYLARLGDITKYQTPYGNLFDLLSDNKPFTEKEEFAKMMGMNYCLPPNVSAIRTVRELFHTIDERDQIPVFVAVEDEAHELLESFEQASTYAELNRLQKQMQQFTVTVYSTQKDLIQQLEQLDNQALDVSIMFTDSDFLYNEKFGLSTSALGFSHCIVL